MSDEELARAVINKYGYLVFAWDAEPKEIGEVIQSYEIAGAQTFKQPFVVIAETTHQEWLEHNDYMEKLNGPLPEDDEVSPHYYRVTTD